MRQPPTFDIMVNTFSKSFLILYTFFCLTSIFAQNSFIKTTSDFDDPLVRRSQISISKNGNSTIAIPGYPGFNILDFDNIGTLKNARQIRIDNTNEVHWINIIRHVESDPLISFSLSFNTEINGVCKIGKDESDSWCRKTSFIPTFTTFSYSTSNGEILSELLDSTGRASISIAKLSSSTGLADWSYSYQDQEVLSGKYFVNQISKTKGMNYIIQFSNFPSNTTAMDGLLKITENGEISHGITVDSENFSVFRFSDTDSLGQTYLYGKFLNQDSIGNKEDGFIAKFDDELNLIWAKRLYAENFNFFELSIKAIPSGGVLFSYSRGGDLPIIVGNIDNDGNLVWQRGYSFFSPEMEIGIDNSLYFLSEKKYFNNGITKEALVFAKTNPDGSFENCSQFTTCLSLFDLDLPIRSCFWNRDTLLTPPLLDFSIEPLSVNIEDHCGTPRPPNPYFDTPDTICQNQCLRPDSLYNHLAHAVEWTITGNDILFESQDISFNYCFNEPGKYQIEQEIWLLGCSEFFTREVVVLPDSLGDLLGDDRVICDDTIAVLEPNAIRPLREYSWSDSTRDSSLTASESGIYGVEVSDGYCSASDEIEIRFFDELFSGIDLELPTDTNICQELLPFTLTPKSDFSNEFFINGSTNPQSNFEIQTAGNYQISTKIEDCEITKNFNLSLTPCEVDIYIPSSFSPNNDGINDLLEPLGNDFMGQRLQVFDRWGGLLFETKEAPFAWDGSKVEEGVYVVTFSYLNLKNQREEMVSGDVLVVR